METRFSIILAPVGTIGIYHDVHISLLTELWIIESADVYKHLTHSGVKSAAQ